MRHRPENHLPSCIVLISALLVLNACAGTVPTFNPDNSDPQLLVDPPSVSLGVATLTKTPIVFSGCNFPPGDSVIIKLMAVEKEGQSIEIPIANADIDAAGKFSTELSKLSKISDFLRADTELDEEMEPVVILSRPSIAAGEYLLEAHGMQQSGKIARTGFTLEKPSLGDRFKDWVGRVFLKKIKKA